MLGLVCHFVEERKKKNGTVEIFNKFETKTLQLGAYKRGKYTNDLIKSVYLHNVKKTLEIMPEVVSTGIKLFRLSSNLLPLYDQVPSECWDNQQLKDALNLLGQYVRSNNMRVCVHPGQFCVLSSDSDAVVAKSFEELSIHGWLFDQMGLDRSTNYAINIHGGKSDRHTRLIDQIKSLPDNVRKRLTLENDETAYNVVDLLQVHQKTDVPICFDSHHYTFNDGDLTFEEAYSAACQTWPKNIKPLQHLSNTEPEYSNGSFADRRKHSKLIHYVPKLQLHALRDDTIDVEIESKYKNIAIYKMSKDFEISL